MPPLPNGARCSDLAIHPQNWNTSKAKASDDWYVSYRYYNSAGKVKQVTIRSNIRDFPTVSEKRKVIRDLVAQEMDLLRNRGFDPITKTFHDEVINEIHPETTLMTALRQAREKLTCSKKTKDNIKRVLNILEPVATASGIQLLPVYLVKRRHVLILLERAEKERKLSPTNYNHYRAYLMMLFKKLVTLQVLEYNPVDKELPKREIIHRIRLTLTQEERKLINGLLHEKYYTFWRYLHIFFHSGARTAELFRLTGSDVQLDEQRYKITIRKGKRKEEVWKTIKDVALPLWREVMEKCKPNDFVFSRNLEPGSGKIDPDQITKRWYKHIKKPLGIKADFYSLKHSHSTELAEILSEADAAKHNSHSSTAMVRKIYDTTREQREADRIKKINNKFA